MKIRNILTTAITAVMLMAAVVTPVHADENCDNQGPYGICVPDTDLVIGDVTVPQEAMLLMGASYIVGAALLVNSQVLKKKVAK